MATAVETLDKLERRLTITFPLSDVRSEVEKRLKKQAKTAKAPGFRPGKVPLKMVAAQYGYQIESDVLNDRVGRAFNEAARENELRVAGFPKIEPKEEAPEGMLAFDATFEVFPEVVIGDLSSRRGRRRRTRRNRPCRSRSTRWLFSPDRLISQSSASRDCVGKQPKSGLCRSQRNHSTILVAGFSPRC